MTNPVTGHTELAAAQSQPEVPVNFADRIIAQMVGGSITINFASDANRTLLLNNPPTSTDEWPYQMIHMTDTGVLLTTGRDVIYPNVGSIGGATNSRAVFLFKNATAQTLTVKRSGQTGVAVTAGNTAWLRHNGTDIEAIRNPV
jgi:hypothetical protein